MDWFFINGFIQIHFGLWILFAFLYKNSVYNIYWNKNNIDAKKMLKKP
jgi:hypothetical protein